MAEAQSSAMRYTSMSIVEEEVEHQISSSSSPSKSESMSVSVVLGAEGPHPADDSNDADDDVPSKVVKRSGVCVRDCVLKMLDEMEQRVSLE
jgi:hypothetical protein